MENKEISESSEKVQRGSTGLALKAGFWYVVSNFLVKGLAFITTPIFARLMSPTHYGEFSNYASWQSTLLIITSAELYNTLGRAYYDYTEDYDKYVSSVTVTSCVITALIYVVFLLCGDWIYRVVAIPPEFVHVLFFTLLFQSCKTIFLTRERTLYHYKSVALVSVLNLVIPTGISLVLVLLAPMELRLGARIYGCYVPMAMIGLVCTVIMLFRGRTFRWEHAKYALVLAMPMLVHYFTAYLLSSTNTIITKSMLGAEAAAVVSISTSTIHILTILFQSVSGAVTTWLMDNLEQKKFKTARTGTLLYTAALAVVGIGVSLLAPEVVWILGGRQYAAAALLIPGMVLSVVFQSATTVFSIILTYDKNVVRPAVWTGVVAVISIGIKIWLAPIYGYAILPWINVIAFGFLFFVNYFLVKKAGYGANVTIKGMTAIIAVVAVFAAASFFLYEHTLVRWCVIGVIGLGALAVMFRYRKELMKLLRARSKKKKQKNQPKAE